MGLSCAILSNGGAAHRSSMLSGKVNDTMDASAVALLLIALFLLSLFAGFLWVQWRRETARRFESEIALSATRRELDAAMREAERLSQVFGVAINAFPRPVL